MNMPKIVFKNQPKLSEDAVDAHFNERRMILIPFIEEYISLSDHFAGEEAHITFAQTGISSLVSIIETAKGKSVLKVALSRSYADGEAQFLKAWERAGVRVPHVFDEGKFGIHPYTLMEYINAPLVGDAYTHEEMIEKGIYLEMGNILRIMHEPVGEGYGFVVDGKGEYITFKEWVEGPDMQKRIEYVREQGLLADEHGSWSSVSGILINHVLRENKSSFCHDDFGGNMFATNPLTVFDPNPRFNNRYIDIGRTVVNYLTKGVFPHQLIEGYFKTEQCDEKVLHASIFLNILMKLPYSYKKGRDEVIRNWREYLVQNKYLLEK